MPTHDTPAINSSQVRTLPPAGEPKQRPPRM
jgi:hypothetical protein